MKTNRNAPLAAVSAALLVSGGAWAQEPAPQPDSNLGPAVVLESQAGIYGETAEERRNRRLMTGAAVVGAVVLGVVLLDDDDDAPPASPPPPPTPPHHAAHHGG